MSTVHFHVCAIAREEWEPGDGTNALVDRLAPFVEDALGIESRIMRGINLEDERTRYNLCCDRIESLAGVLPRTLVANQQEFTAAVEAQHRPMSMLGAGYLDALRAMYELAPSKAADLRIGRTFFPPESVPEHMIAFQQLAKEAGLDDDEDVVKRCGFLELAEKGGFGVIEMQVEFVAGIVEGQEDSEVAEEALDGEMFSTVMAGADDVAEEGENLHEILKRQIDGAIGTLRDGGLGAVNFSNMPHNIITEVLHEQVYHGNLSVRDPEYIQVVYTDGSQGKPFPLRCLTRREGKELTGHPDIHPIRVALMSMRHLEMDREVDMAWFRNREVSKSRTLGDTDNFCYEQTCEELRKSRTQGAARLFLFQTGFQPAVIGFYRALVEELISRADSGPYLEVVPHYFHRKTGYFPGKQWR